MRTAVIVHQGALGDFVLSLPVYTGLYRLHPDLALHFVCRSEHADLISGQPYFGGADSCDASWLTPFYLDTGWEKAPLPAALNAAETLFWFGQDSTRVVAERLRRRLNRPVHWVQSFPTGAEDPPVSDFLLAQMRRLGYPLPAALPSLAPPGRAQTPRGVLIHPGSGGRAKIWPLARWYALILRLIDRPIAVRIVLGPADAALRPFADAMVALGCGLEVQPRLTRLVELLSAVRLYVGNDSGVTHLAAALGTTTVAVFGPASTPPWRPRGRRVRVVEDLWDCDEAPAWPAPADPANPLVIAAVEQALLDQPPHDTETPAALTPPPRTESAASDDGEGFPAPAPTG